MKGLARLGKGEGASSDVSNTFLFLLAVLYISVLYLLYYYYRKIILNPLRVKNTVQKKRKRNSATSRTEKIFKWRVSEICPCMLILSHVCRFQVSSVI